MSDCERIVPTIGQPGARARIFEAGNRALAERRHREGQATRLAEIRVETRQRALDLQRGREVRAAAEALLRQDEALRAMAAKVSRHTATVIIREVAAAHGVTPEDITGRSRKQRIIPARQEAAYRLVQEAKLTALEAGRRLGGRDHTTVLHHARRHAARIGETP